MINGPILDRKPQANQSTRSISRWLGRNWFLPYASDSVFNCRTQDNSKRDRSNFDPPGPRTEFDRSWWATFVCIVTFCTGAQLVRRFTEWRIILDEVGGGGSGTRATGEEGHVIAPHQNLATSQNPTGRHRRKALDVRRHHGAKLSPRWAD